MPREYDLESNADRVAMIDDYIAKMRAAMISAADKGYVLSHLRYELTHYSEMHPKYRVMRGEMRMAPWTRSQIENATSLGFFADDKRTPPAIDDPSVEPR